MEAFYFTSDYKNLKAVCKNSQGGDCSDGDVFDGGAVDVSGIEISGSHIFNGSDRHTISSWINIIHLQMQLLKIALMMMVITGA